MSLESWRPSWLVLALLLCSVGCDKEAGIEGTWRYDPDRFDELETVKNADSPSNGFAFGDESRRDRLLRVLRREAEVTTITITRDQIIWSHRGHTSETVEVGYVVSEREGNRWVLEILEKGKKLDTVLELRGDKLTISDPSGVRYVLRRGGLQRFSPIP